MLAFCVAAKIPYPQQRAPESMRIIIERGWRVHGLRDGSPVGVLAWLALCRAMTTCCREQA